MIDSHVHILPGVDDGAQDYEQALRMLATAKTDGVTHWIVTPHLNHACSKFTYEEMKDKFVKWRVALVENRDYENIIFGAEVYIDETFMEDISTMNPLATFENSNYMLIEFNKNTKFEMMQAAIHELKMRQVRPIMAHVDVYKALVDNPDYVKTLSEDGALIQVSAKCLLDKQYHTFIKSLIHHNAIDLVASDGHNLSDRKPVLSEAYNRVAKVFSKAWADRLFIESPKTVFDGLHYHRPLTAKSLQKSQLVGLSLAVFATLVLIIIGVNQLDLFNKNGAVNNGAVNNGAEVYDLTAEPLAVGDLEVENGNGEDAQGDLTSELTTQPSQDPEVANQPPDSSSYEATYEAIEEDYVNQLYALQDQYTADVKRIFNAIQDTRNFVKDEVNRKKIINAYLDEIGALETICDRNVYDLLYAFQNELEKYKYEVVIIEEIRAEYRRIKEETKNAYLANF